MITSESTTIDAEYVDFQFDTASKAKKAALADGLLETTKTEQQVSLIKGQSQAPLSSLIDPFSPEVLRIDQSFLSTGAAKKLLTTVPVRKPNKQDFVRVHSDPAYRETVGLIELKESRETFLLLPNVAKELSQSEFYLATVYCCINRQKVLSVWPVKLPTEDGKQNDWHTSAAEAAERAMTNWIRLAANMSLGAYEISEAIANYGEPEWPGLSFMEILKIAFKNRLIDSAEHIVIQQLRGQA